MDNTKKDASVFSPLALKNSFAYPVIIFGLNIDSTQAGLNTSLLTIQGTGEVALQNLMTKNDTGPVGLKSSILLQGKTTVLDSAISCDPANTNPAMIVSSNGNTFRKVAVNECTNGLRVAGDFNNFHDLAVSKTATDEAHVGGIGLNMKFS